MDKRDKNLLYYKTFVIIIAFKYENNAKIYGNSLVILPENKYQTKMDWKRKIISTAVALLLSNIAALAQQRIDVHTFKLHNGMAVWINFDNTQPKDFGAVVVKAGAKDCPNSGIAHYLEHLLFKGTKNIGTIDYEKEQPWLDSISSQYDLLARTKDSNERTSIQHRINNLSIKAADYAIPNEFSNLISLYGGTGLNAYTSFDETVFHNSFSPQYLRQWCELNAERLRDPVFRLFQGELETVYEEKNMYADNLLTSSAEKVQQYALAGTPYAYPILGATDSLKNPILSEMMQFFKTYYVPENMGVILNLSATPSPSGRGDAIPLDSLKEILEGTFGKLQTSTSSNTSDNDKKFNLRDFRSLPAFRLKVPIPIVKAGGFIWQAPDEHSKDYAAFKVMTSMLTNSDKTGLIDSLTNNGKIMFATGMGYNFKDFSAWGFGFVPKIFGARKKAERLCFQQINKIKNGEFSDDDLESEKLTLVRNNEKSLETINGRSKAMINAFSHGLSWEDVIDESKKINAVTKEDVMRVAKRYLNDDSLKIVKKFGRYPKEHVSQPGYKPIKPQNTDKRSAYATELAKIPVKEVLPKLIDTQSDAKRKEIASLVNLYTVSNPTNDIFTLQIIYRRGSRNDSRLTALADYLNDIGTTKHDKNSFGKLLRQQGATISASASGNDFTLTLTGFDNRFKASMDLLMEFLKQPKADNGKYKNLIHELKLKRKTFFKQNRNIADAVMEKVAKGENSAYLTHLTPKYLKQMDGDKLVNLFKELQHWQTDIVYCGRLDANDVENTIKRCIDIDSVTHEWTPMKQPLKANEGNTIYIYDNPSARQTVVGSYSQIAPMLTSTDRTRLLLWGNYFGSGMQSVTFQEIREFRSLAYYAHGTTLMTDLKTAPDMPCGYETFIGTQSDKAMQATLVLDSLLNDMPLRASNVTAAKHSIVNSINNGYPSFRSIGSSVAYLRLHRYTNDPDEDIVKAISALNAEDVENFYKAHIQHQPHAIIIVGNKKKLNLTELSKIGKIKELKKEDIYK